MLLKLFFLLVEAKIKLFLTHNTRDLLGKMQMSDIESEIFSDLCDALSTSSLLKAAAATAEFYPSLSSNASDPSGT